MSAPPLLSLKDFSLSYAEKRILSDLSVALYKGDKVCLVGRNGCGKTTLLKVLSRLLEGNSGEFFCQPGTKVSYLPQEVPTFLEEQTCLDFIIQTTFSAKNKALLEEPEDGMHQYEAMLDRLGLSPLALTTHLSGGERRRLLLAKALAGKPDVLLLDEPTNHLDLSSIQWLEDHLSAHKGAYLVISHDRTFSENTSNRIWWLDRGTMRSLNKGFKHFEAWSDDILLQEEREMQRLNQKLKLETEWLHYGVTARRKRNQGRLQKLHDLRERKQAALSNQPASLKIQALQAVQSSKMVIEADGISKRFGSRSLVKNFSTRILDGDRIGLIGPNGAGKTTLIKMLVKELEPDEGTVRLGASINVTYVDQHHTSLNPKETLWENLCETGGDRVSTPSGSRHIVAYLRDFLFNERQIKAPVSLLSGGEKNRLALAKAFTKPCNLLILDEPTNDLDMDSLDLLVELLSDFQGTFLVVSHDRDFLDKLTTSIIAVEGNEEVKEYVGGYQDYVRQRGDMVAEMGGKPKSSASKSRSQLQEKSQEKAQEKLEEKSPKARRLSYHEKRELEALPTLLAQLEGDIRLFEQKLSDPNFYGTNPAEFEKVSQKLHETRTRLDQAEHRWLELEE